MLGTLAQEQAHLGVITAIIDKLGTRTLELGDNRRVIAIASINALEHDHPYTGLLELIAHRLGNTLTIGLFVMYDCNLAGLDVINDHLCRSGALLIITANGAENGVIALVIGDCWCSGRGGNHHDTLIIVEVGSGERGRPTHMTRDGGTGVVYRAGCPHSAPLGLISV